MTERIGGARAGYMEPGAAIFLQCGRQLRACRTFVGRFFPRIEQISPSVGRRAGARDPEERNTISRNTLTLKIEKSKDREWFFLVIAVFARWKRRRGRKGYRKIYIRQVSCLMYFSLSGFSFFKIMLVRPTPPSPRYAHAPENFPPTHTCMCARPVCELWYGGRPRETHCPPSRLSRRVHSRIPIIRKFHVLFKVKASR